MRDLGVLLDGLRTSATGSPRRAAVAAALGTALLLLLVQAWRGALDGWSLGAAAAAVLSSAVLFRRRGHSRTATAEPPTDDRQLSGASDPLLAHIPDPLILIDRRGLVVAANEAAQRLLPLLKRDRPLSFALRSPDVLDAVGRVLRTGQAMRVEHGERIPTERIFDVHVGPLGPKDGAEIQPGGVVLLFRDLTEARRLEQLRADFVANASHELRTPLASLLGFIETLQGPARNDPAARERFLGIMRSQAERMARLIQDLLSLSRVEMRQHVAPETPVELDAIVRQVVDALRPLAAERGVEIRLQFEAPPFRVLGDRDELARVVENLVENAIKYGESGGRVDVSVKRAPEQAERSGVMLAVRDYGPGIAAEHLPRLTERFYRVDVEQSRQKGGTGLGLAIVKHIIGRHRGRLTIRSEPGQGAEFAVELPEQGGGP